MRRTLRWLLSLLVLIGAAGVSGTPAGAATAPSHGIEDRILAIKGMSLIKEKKVDGYRYFILDYEQPIDHRNPSKGTFKQRISLLHKGVDRPTVFFTSGYGLNEEPSRSEPTQLVDGNQVSLEYRFFTPSRPKPADWSKLDIQQAAADQHRVFAALKRIYGERWVDTGGSKGGMTATYYRRFYPHDMDGTVAYVAPNDVRNGEDSAYYRFFENVGSAACRNPLNATQREIFKRRPEMVARYEKLAKEKGYTFSLVGNADKAFEIVAQDLVWGFWQYHLQDKECGQVPGPGASTDALWKWADEIGGWDSGTDQGLEYYTPYYYQAGTQLGSPDYESPVLDDLREYPGLNVPRTYVPRRIPMAFDSAAMKDIDQWVRHRSSRMLFVYGQNDPWGAEPFTVGKGTRDAHVYTAPGANHGANIAQLKADEKAAATRALLKWAGVAPAAGGQAKRLTAPDTKLDKQPHERKRLPMLP
jgi:hypothetical protein